MYVLLGRELSGSCNTSVLGTCFCWLFVEVWACGGGAFIAPGPCGWTCPSILAPPLVLLLTTCLFPRCIRSRSWPFTGSIFVRCPFTNTFTVSSSSTGSSNCSTYRIICTFLCIYGINHDHFVQPKQNYKLFFNRQNFQTCFIITWISNSFLVLNSKCFLKLTQTILGMGPYSFYHCLSNSMEVLLQLRYTNYISNINLLHKTTKHAHCIPEKALWYIYLHDLMIARTWHYNVSSTIQFIQTKQFFLSGMNGCLINRMISIIYNVSKIV